MDSFFIYLLKASCILILFLGSYHLFLKKETFFSSNRIFLIAGLLASFLFPLITITKVTYVTPQTFDTTDFTAVTSAVIMENSTTESFSWWQLLLLVYMLGMLFFSVKLVLQLRSIQQIKKKSEIVSKENLVHVRTHFKISPFSFFRHIFYCPKQFKRNELKTILLHEKMHAEGLHSIDILMTEIVFILLWFNPAIWLYKTVVKQNLEFLADSRTCKISENKKEYQYLMLKQAINTNKITIANPFFNSIIKKRIVMLNQHQSRKINTLKLLFVLPLLALFIVSFNTKEVFKFSEAPNTIIEEYSDQINFKSPIHPTDIKEISAEFGETKSPFTQETVFHNGMDIVASAGKNVLASAPGVVATVGSDATNGNYVAITHGADYSTRYLHLKDHKVKEGDEIKAGDVIGHVGNTGKSTGPHLHFEVLASGKAVNPASIIPFKTREQGVKDKNVSVEKTITAAKSIEVLIDKDTSDEELMKMKNDLAEDGVDFSYTTVRNDAREIIDISLEVKGTGKNGASFKNSHNTSDSKNGIAPLVVFVDIENNLVSIGTKGVYKSKVSKISTSGSSVWISSEDNNSVDVWSGLDEIGEHEDIVIIKKDGQKKIIIDGKEVDKENLHGHNVKVVMEGDESDSDNHFSFNISSDENEDPQRRVKIKKRKSGKGKEVMIIKDTDDDSDIEVINPNEGFFFVETEGGDPLYIIDGKEASKKEVKRLSPKQIATIDVSKGKAATKKYGKKAKDGVVEIITKKKK